MNISFSLFGKLIILSVTKPRIETQSKIQGIYGGYEDHCVERGISTMRLALGYKSGLPKGWPVKCAKKTKTIIQLCALAFPNNGVRFWAKEPWYKTPDKCHYQGTHFNFVPEDNEYLTAFVYAGKDAPNAHFVIGEATPCDSNIEIWLRLQVKI